MHVSPHGLPVVQTLQQLLRSLCLHSCSQLATNIITRTNDQRLRMPALYDAGHVHDLENELRGALVARCLTAEHHTARELQRHTMQA